MESFFAESGYKFILALGLLVNESSAVKTVCAERGCILLVLDCLKKRKHSSSLSKWCIWALMVQHYFTDYHLYPLCCVLLCDLWILRKNHVIFLVARRSMSLNLSLSLHCSPHPILFYSAQNMLLIVLCLSISLLPSTVLPILSCSILHRIFALSTPPTRAPSSTREASPLLSALSATTP